MIKNILRKTLEKISFKKTGFVLFVVLVLAILFEASYIIGEDYYAKRNDDPGKSVFKAVYPPDKASFEDEIIIYDAMHRLANSKIPAEKNDRSGRLEINQKQLNAVRTIVSEMNYPDKSYIFAALSRWEKDDFSLVEDEHNYFADRLGAASAGTQKTP